MSDDKLRNAIASVLVNASNYPDGVSHHILGRDMSSLIDKVTEAARAVGYSRPAPSAKVQAVAARVRVNADKRAGVQTPEWIVELADGE